jgi:hypothetical protein
MTKTWHSKSPGPAAKQYMLRASHLEHRREDLPGCLQLVVADEQPAVAVDAIQD